MQINASNEIAISTLNLGSDFFVNLAQTRLLTEEDTAEAGGGGAVLATNDDTNARGLCTLMC